MQCGMRLTGGGWLSRFLGWLFPRPGWRPGSAILSSEDEAIVLRGPELRIEDARFEQIGSSRDLPDDLPSDLRTKISALRRSAAERGEPGDVRVATGRVYIYTDESGVEKRFKSLDEMPPEIRRAFQQAGKAISHQRDPLSEWPL